MEKISLYFLFYVAMILELLIFIVDRDEAEEALKTSTQVALNELIDTYSKPLKISAASQVIVKDSSKTTITVHGLWGEREERSYSYYLRDSARYPFLWRIEKDPDTHILVLHVNLVQGFKGKREDTISLGCQVLRDPPEYFERPTRTLILDSLRRRLGNTLLVQTDSIIKIHVATTGEKVRDPLEPIKWK